jgi:DeoR family suf operon transcriptional repressor
MAEFRPVEEKDDGHEGNHGFLFMEHTCAISNVAESFPSVCGHELEMFAAILPDCSVQRTHWLIDGQHRCVYLIKKN